MSTVHETISSQLNYRIVRQRKADLTCKASEKKKIKIGFLFFSNGLIYQSFNPHQFFFKLTIPCENKVL